MSIRLCMLGSLGGRGPVPSYWVACLSLYLLRRKKIRSPIMASPATPPTIPPAVAPVLLFFGSDVGLGRFVFVDWDDVADVLVEKTELEAVLIHVSLVDEMMAVNIPITVGGMIAGSKCRIVEPLAVVHLDKWDGAIGTEDPGMRALDIDPHVQCLHVGIQRAHIQGVW